MPTHNLGNDNWIFKTNKTEWIDTFLSLGTYLILFFFKEHLFLKIHSAEILFEIYTGGYIEYTYVLKKYLVLIIYRYSKLCLIFHIKIIEHVTKK